MTYNITASQPKTAMVQETSSAGKSYIVDCPYCGKFKTLSDELFIMSAFCDHCQKPFKLKFQRVEDER